MVVESTTNSTAAYSSSDVAIAASRKDAQPAPSAARSLKATTLARYPSGLGRVASSSTCAQASSSVKSVRTSRHQQCGGSATTEGPYRVRPLGERHPSGLQ
jgi:hypothetical protein